MSKIVLDMSMSVVGFITGPDDGMEHGLGVNGERLHDHHDGLPIFVLTHAAPDEPAPGHARYVTDGVESCVAQAKAVAGGRDILLHGAATAQECLRAGLLDEMELHLMRVLLGQCCRLFEDVPPDHIELELLRALDGPGVLHPRYHVQSAG
jgi:dihydrofolate reductase